MIGLCLLGPTKLLRACLVSGVTYKSYRGMGSVEAMKAGSSDRYFQKNDKKLVPEGIGPCAYVVPLQTMSFRCLAGSERQWVTPVVRVFSKCKKMPIVRITSAGLSESQRTM